MTFELDEEEALAEALARELQVPVSMLYVLSRIDGSSLIANFWRDAGADPVVQNMVIDYFCKRWLREKRNYNV